MTTSRLDIGHFSQFKAISEVIVHRLMHVLPSKIYFSGLFFDLIYYMAYSVPNTDDGRPTGGPKIQVPVLPVVQYHLSKGNTRLVCKLI